LKYKILTNFDPNGFKQKFSNPALSAKLQLLTAHVLDDSDFVMVASLDLSSAFENEHINLFLDIIKTISLPGDVIGHLNF
jgi:hypothetical protein